MKSPGSFQRGLKSRHVSLIALSGIIGSSYFLGTGYVFNQIGPSVFFAYILGGIITYLTMACLAELTITSPSHGSFITYIHQLISPSLACGVGWSYWFSWVVFIPSEFLAAGILLHSYTPEVPVYMWTILMGLGITFVNILPVKHFGEMEFWLSMVKICLLVGFSVLAIFIFFGIIGSEKHEMIGLQYLLHNGGLFPNGYTILFINMVILINNFQGSEIIGLSAAESHDPQKTIPSALRKISYRICAFYLVPTFLLAAIFPWQDANLTGSIFATALQKYGLTTVAHVFSFLIIAGAISAANSGLYATIRSLHALSLKGMAPPQLHILNKHGIPIRATIVTFVAVWIMLLLLFIFSSHNLYANFLAISGFTGTMCWIGICWAQLRSRRMQTELPKYRIPLFPYLTLLAIWLQIFCLCIVVLSPKLRTAFYFGTPVFLIPIIAYKLFNKDKPTKV